MIAQLRGPVSHVGLDRLVVDVGGVGVLVHTPPSVAAGARIGQETTLATSLVVREDSLTLYGFATPGERDTFELAQTVSGVGPRVALAILSVLSPEELSAAVAAEDTRTLTKVPGIGTKGAQRIALELRDKMPALASSGGGEAPAAAPAAGAWREQVVEALVGLGYSAKQAGDATEKVDGGDDGTPVDVSQALRAALRVLAR
ncbi:Holliday junction branch migration protein RuvA [Janibacter alkaliphilus]|uniref:Holliday junction branch migration complex subunit RuvA n=1 Tax=Janibacter alkaliphilus TaxID=1069963 RepID=A0A852XBC0_9MICO|nr:Holliday junction DNA helicase RuvA [Janibacter alkaliphilus]